jgi:hypothetical protein
MSNPEDKITSCVILDESDSYQSDFILDVRPLSEKASIIIERHLHHFYTNDHFEQRVLKHWIPVNFSSYRIRRISIGGLSKFFMVDNDDDDDDDKDNEVVCMY